MNPFIKAAQVKQKLPGYWVARAYALNHQTLQHLASRHREKFLKAFKYIQTDVIANIPVTRGVASRKYDGISSFFYWEKGQDPFIFHSSFGVEVGLPCAKELADALEQAGHTSAFLVGELITTGNRSHSYEVIRAVNSPEKLEDLQKLRFVILDVIILDKKDHQDKDYIARTEVLQTLPKTPLSFAPEFVSVDSIEALNRFYKSEVDAGQEGIVFHEASSPTAWKIKPKFNVDLAIVGFVEGTAELTGHAVSMMGALIKDGYIQLVARVGVADPALREPLFREFSKNRVESEYMDADSDSRPIIWIKPTKVMEINAEEVTWEDAKGATNTNAVLKLEGDRYVYQGQGEIVKPFHSTLERMRDDKTVAECVFSQINGCDLKLKKAPTEGSSNVLVREVYAKTIKGKPAVKKLVAWENQQNGGPKFVAHTVDLSAGRAEPLKEDTKVTNDRAELATFIETWKEKELGKGWVAATV